MSKQQSTGSPKRPALAGRSAATFWNWRRLRVVLLVAVCMVAPLLWWQWQAERHQMQTLLTNARQQLEADPRAAAQQLEEVIALSGTRFPEAHVLWARALLRLRQPLEALGAFSQLPQPALVNHEELLLLADDANRAGVPLLANLALEAIPAHSPQRADALDRLITMTQQLGQLETSLRLAEELRQLRPNTTEPALRMAVVREQLLDPQGAVDDYTSALGWAKTPDERLAALRSLVRLEILLGQREMARKHQDELNIHADSRQPEDRLQEALLWRMEGQSAAAQAEIDQLLAENSENLAAQELRGTLAMDQHDWGAAEVDFRSLVTRQPWNKNAHYRLAMSLQHLGRPDEAQDHFEINRRLTDAALRVLALRAAPDAGTPDNLRALQTAYQEIGQHQLAESLRRQLESLNTN